MFKHDNVVSASTPAESKRRGEGDPAIVKEARGMESVKERVGEGKEMCAYGKES